MHYIIVITTVVQNIAIIIVLILALCRSLRIGRISAFLAIKESKNRDEEMPSATTKARGISEIYTGRKRREGVVKVFRCKFLIVRVRTSDEFLNSPPSYVRWGRKGWHSSNSTCARFDVAAHVSLSPHILPIYRFLRASHRYHCQNGNGTIKIRNRCYSRSFVVPYGRSG